MEKQLTLDRGRGGGEGLVVVGFLNKVFVIFGSGYGSPPGCRITTTVGGGRGEISGGLENTQYTSTYSRRRRLSMDTCRPGGWVYICFIPSCGMVLYKQGRWCSNARPHLSIPTTQSSPPIPKREEGVTLESRHFQNECYLHGPNGHNAVHGFWVWDRAGLGSCLCSGHDSHHMVAEEVSE